jgi:hexokinase
LQKYKKTIPVSVANDTVCLLLAGNGAENASLIAGTGVNIGIRLSDQKKRSIINLEAGNFNRFALPDFLKIIDAASEKPGNHLFEKATSGKYLANVFNTLIQQQSILVNPIRTSQELSTLSYAANKDASGDVARMILQQSAFLIATAIAALYAFYQMPKSLTIIGEGSLLWKGWNYQENIQIKLKDFAIQKDTIQIKHIQDSSINGAIGLVVR